VKRARADAVRLPFWQLLALRSQGLPNGDWWERVGAEFNLLTARDPARYWRPYKRHELALREQAVRRGVTRAAMKREVCGAAFEHICSDAQLLSARAYPIAALWQAADRFTGTVDGAPRLRRQQRQRRPTQVSLDTAGQAGLLPVVRPSVLDRLAERSECDYRLDRLAALTRPRSQQRRLVALWRARPSLFDDDDRAAALLGVAPGTVRVMSTHLKQKARTAGL